MNKAMGIAIIVISLIILAGLITVYAFEPSIPNIPGDDDDDDNDEIQTYYFDTEGIDDTWDVCRGCHADNLMWLGFRVPEDVIVTGIDGEIKMDLLGHGPCEVWFDIYNKCTKHYVDAVYIIDFPQVQEGWIPVDFSIDQEIITYWIGFAGCHYADTTTPYNRVMEFRGNVYYKQSSGCTILDTLLSMNPFRNTTPGSPSCNC